MNNIESNTRILLGVGLALLFVTSVVSLNWPLYVDILMLFGSLYLVYTAGIKRCFIYDFLGIESPIPDGKED